MRREQPRPALFDDVMQAQDKLSMMRRCKLQTMAIQVTAHVLPASDNLRHLLRLQRCVSHQFQGPHSPTPLLEDLASLQCMQA